MISAQLESHIGRRTSLSRQRENSRSNSFRASVGKGDRRGRGAVELLVVLDVPHHAVLEDLGPEPDFLERRFVELADDGVGDVADARTGSAAGACPS